MITAVMDCSSHVNKFLSFIFLLIAQILFFLSHFSLVYHAIHTTFNFLQFSSKIKNFMFYISSNSRFFFCLCHPSQSVCLFFSFIIIFLPSNSYLGIMIETLMWIYRICTFRLALSFVDSGKCTTIRDIFSSHSFTFFCAVQSLMPISAQFFFIWIWWLQSSKTMARDKYACL